MARSPSSSGAGPPIPGIDRLLAGIDRWLGRRIELPGAGEPWHEPTTGLLVDALVGDESVRRVIERRLELEEAELAWPAEHQRFLDLADGALLYPGSPRAIRMVSVGG